MKHTKRYNEFTEEEIESLARECDRMAEENSRLQDHNAQLLVALQMARSALALTGNNYSSNVLEQIDKAIA